MEPTDSIVRAVETASRVVVHVRAVESDEETITLGSGLVLDHSHVLTNAQIVSGDEKRITLRAESGRKYDATVVGVDPLYFITVLELDGWLPVEPLERMTIDQIPVGLPLVAVGNAVGYDYNATFGVATGADRTIYRPERFPVDGLLITDARVHPGNTGGALVSLDGRLVAMSGIPWQHGLSLAVHADVAWRVANQMIDHGQATHAWLGFSGEPEVIDQAMVDLFSLSFNRGVKVAHIAPGGPGAQAGVQLGDMVVRAKEQPVTGLGSIRRMLSLHRHGEQVPITLLRDGDVVEAELPVDEMPTLHQRGEDS